MMVTDIAGSVNIYIVYRGILYQNDYSGSQKMLGCHMLLQLHAHVHIWRDLDIHVVLILKLVSVHSPVFQCW